MSLRAARRAKREAPIDELGQVGLGRRLAGPCPDPLGLAQPTVSHHLKKLVDSGLLEREQRGKWAYFSLNRDAVEKLAAVADLKGVCC